MPCKQPFSTLFPYTTLFRSQCFGGEDLAPPDHEHEVEPQALQQRARLGIVDARYLVQRHAESAAQRPVVGGARARGRHLGFEGQHRDDRRARFQDRLQRGNSLHVKPDPTELHRRYMRVTSSTASITSATSWSDMRALSGRLSIRSKLLSATGKRCGA